MELRKAGKSGLRLSALGLGANPFGTTVHGEEAVAVIRHALDLGITYIDTADVYSQGASEELVGKAVAGRRAEVVIGSKIGFPMLAHGPREFTLSRRYIMRGVEGSLRRLGTDYIDLYQIHGVDYATPVEETLRALDDLVRQGKVLYVGCSNHTAWEMVRAAGVAERLGFVSWVTVQPRWNLVQGLDDPHLLPACRTLGIGIIPYTPLAAGLLTGKYRRGEVPPPGTRLGDLPRVRERYSDVDLAAVERLRPWAEARGHTTGELAIAWLLAHPEVSSVIAGARTVEQLEKNLRAVTWTLSPQEREEARRLAQG